MIQELKLLEMAYTGRDSFLRTYELKSLVHLHLADKSQVQMSFAKGHRMARAALQGLIVEERDRARREGKAELLEALNRILQHTSYGKKIKPAKLPIATSNARTS